MKPPIHRLRKSEIIWLSTHTCAAHRHSYLSHYDCFLREKPNTCRIGYIDLETSNLDADYGIILTYCILDDATGEIASGQIRPADLKFNGQEDKRIVAACIKDMLKFDKLVTFYGTGFDLPYIRTRALACGLEFPTFGTLKHQDVYYIIRNRFKLSRSSQENACRTLLRKTDKTRLDGATWRAAARGEKAALIEVMQHNIFDVQDLQKLYHKVVDYARKQEVSI